MNDKSAGARNLGLVVGLVLVAAVAGAAILTSMRPVPQLDPSSAEGTVQAFFEAVRSDDWEDARALLTSELQSDCEASELATFRDDLDRLVIRDVDVAGSETIVEVEGTRVVVDDPLNPYTYNDIFQFVLTESNGRQAISSLPWQFYCEV